MSVETPLPEPPPGGDGYVTSWPVRAGDVDPDNRLRLDALGRYLHDVAWENLHATPLQTSDPYWIVRRTVIDVLRPAGFPDTVELRRWCSAMSTRWTNMRVSIHGEQGALVESEAFWINISEHTGLPTRISDEGIEYLARTTDEHRLRWKAWLTRPAPPESETDRPFHLRATDIDAYNHLGNAAYWHAVEEYLVDLPKLLARPHRAVIEYSGPILAREHITVRSRTEPVSGSSERCVLRQWFVVDGEVRAAVRVAPLD